VQWSLMRQAYEEEDTCMSNEEEDAYVCPRQGRTVRATPLL
jgi:hypothetical protein